MEAPKVTHALEDYLKAIYQLAEEAQPVIALASRPRPGVAVDHVRDVASLASEGYVTINRRKEIHLTEDGRKVAKGLCAATF